MQFADTTSCHPSEVFEQYYEATLPLYQRMIRTIKVRPGYWDFVGVETPGNELILTALRTPTNSKHVFTYLVLLSSHLFEPLLALSFDLRIAYNVNMLNTIYKVSSKAAY